MANLIKLRYTLYPESGQSTFEKQIDYLNTLGIKEYLHILEPQNIVIGFEKLNNLGEFTHPHIHFHFSTDKNIGAIRKGLTRYWKDSGETRIRAALYSLKQEDDVKDLTAFYRYPLKQLNKEFHNFNKYPVDFDLKLQTVLANEQYNQVVEIARAKALSDSNKQSTFDKLLIYLDELKPNSKETVLSLTLKYYKREKLSMNISTMAGYALTYCSINDLVSDELILEKLKEKFL